MPNNVCLQHIQKWNLSSTWILQGEKKAILACLAYHTFTLNVAGPWIGDPWPSTNLHMPVKKALEECLECLREQPGLGWLWLRPFSACVCLRYREKLLHYWSTIVRGEDWKRQLQFLQRQKTRTGSIMWGGSRLNYWCVRAPVMRTGVYLVPAATHTHTNTHTRRSRMDLQHDFSVVAVSIKGMTGKSCNQ